MNFELNDSQKLMRDSAHSLLAEHYEAGRRKALVEQRGYDPKLWKLFADMGWQALAISEASGGLEGSATDVMVLAEAMGHHCATSPWLISALVAGGLLDRLGTDAQKARWLEPMLAGDIVLSAAFGETKYRGRWTEGDTRAEKTPEGWRLSGAKAMALFAPEAHAVIVSAKVEGGALGLFILDLSQGVPQGLSLNAYRTSDGGSAADIFLDGHMVPADALLADGDTAVAALRAVENLSRLALCAGAVGAMEKANALTVEYLNMREQFGAKLGSFQALQHRAVEMLLEFELAKSLTLAAAIQLQEGNPDAARNLAGAKYQVGHAGRFVGKNAVHLHGGIGVSQEFVIGHYFKYLIGIEAVLGDRSANAKDFAALAA